MQQPDEKQQAAPTPSGEDEALPQAWRRLLAAPKPAVADDSGVLGFFLEVMPEEGAAFARLDVAPVLLAVRNLRMPRSSCQPTRKLVPSLATAGFSM